jgi:hypothetical protein
MVVGLLRVRLAVFEAFSLKDKRRAVKGLKDRLSARHNISIAEVAELDRLRSATLGIAMVANDSRFVDSALREIVDQIEAYPHASLVDFEIEYA